MRSFSVLLTAFLFSCVEKFLGTTSVDSYIETESPIAAAGVLANIGPDGSKSSGALVRHINVLIRHFLLMRIFFTLQGGGRHRQSKH